jgi:hypothetical protein
MVEFQKTSYSSGAPARATVERQHIAELGAFELN